MMLKVIQDFYTHNSQANKLYEYSSNLLLSRIELQKFRGDARLISLNKKYFFQFVIPFAEAISKNWQMLSSDITALICSHYLFCVHARFVDNLLDNDVDQWTYLESINLSNSTYLMARETFAEGGATWNSEVEYTYQLMYQYENALDKVQEIMIDDLWKRTSSIIILPTSTSTKLPTSFLDCYRNYINFMLLIHDIHDVLDDVRKEKRTYMIDSLSKEVSFKLVAIQEIMNSAYLELERIKNTIANLEEKTLFFSEVFPKIAGDFLNISRR